MCEKSVTRNIVKPDKLTLLSGLSFLEDTFKSQELVYKDVQSQVCLPLFCFFYKFGPGRMYFKNMINLYITTNDDKSSLAGKKEVQISTNVLILCFCFINIQHNLIYENLPMGSIYQTASLTTNVLSSHPLIPSLNHP